MTKALQDEGGESELSRRSFAGLGLSALFTMGVNGGLTLPGANELFKTLAPTTGEITDLSVTALPNNGTRATYSTRLRINLKSDLPINSYDGAQHVTMIYHETSGGETIERLVTFAPFIQTGDGLAKVSSIRLKMQFQFGEIQGSRREDDMQFECEINGSPLKSFSCKALRPIHPRTAVTPEALQAEWQAAFARMSANGGHPAATSSDRMEFVGVDPAYKR